MLSVCRIIRALLLSAGVLLASSVSANVITWNFHPGTANCSNASLCFGNQRHYAPAGQPTLTVNGWANTQGNNNQILETGYLALWSGGLGIYNRDYLNGSDANEHKSPEHAIDNNGRFEMVMLAYSQMVELQSLRLGWKKTDSDLSLLAYTGLGAPTMANQTWASLLSSGWSVVGNYANVAVNTQHAINAGNIHAQYWLLGAYNPVYGSGANLNSGNDYIKLYSVSGVAYVPAPAPFLLLALGLAALGLRRRT